MIYTLAVFLPWVAFFLHDRVFSAVFSFILWVILCFPFVLTVAIVIFSHSNLADLGLGNAVLTGLTGFTLQIIWFCSSFFLWVIVTTWCCLVMHSDQRQEYMERLINAINGIVKANSSKSLHPETQQTSEANGMKQSISETTKANSDETNATRIFICVAIFFLAIILLVVFLEKENTTQAITKALMLKTLATSTTKRIATA